MHMLGKPYHSFLHKNIKQVARSLIAVISRVPSPTRKMTPTSLKLGHTFASHLLVTLVKPV